MNTTKSPDIKELKYLLTSNEEIIVKIVLNKIMLNDREESISSSFFLLLNKLESAIRYSFDPRFDFLDVLFPLLVTPENFTASTGAILEAIFPGLLAAIHTVI